MDLLSLKVGDKIRIKLLDDAYLNMYYRGVEGTITKINHKKECLIGDWGKIEIYPEYDEIELIS